MHRIKMLALTALVAATIGTGAAFTGAPSASAATATTTATVADSSERPKICFVFGPWKYCI